MGRFWVGGPCEEHGVEVWLVIDGEDTPGHTAPKPSEYREQWPNALEAARHAEYLNNHQT